MNNIREKIGLGSPLLSPDKNVSNLQMSLTLLMVVALILSNILVVKSIDLFSLPFLANTCSLIAFPVTYILSDVFSEVYGYRWSRTTATWAFCGTLLCSFMFQLMILWPGNAAWENQDALVAILGNTPQIAIASVVAYWLGDFANDRVFQYMKQKSEEGKGFQIRAIASSLVGKYVDGFVFTFIGLSFLPLETKIIMVVNAPFVQICLEALLLPITTVVMKAVKRKEEEIAMSKGAA